jgi:N-acetylglucosamine kinase-like BadF-type ATPase
MKYFLGADVGSSKTQILIADEAGHTIGQGLAGPGNHQVVGYEGMSSALEEAASQALQEARIPVDEITGAGFGISGYDWPSDKPEMLKAIAKLNLQAPLELHNDAVLGLVAGTKDGWGVTVVSGTGCNCWGWDRDREHIGRVTGFGVMTGEAAGSSELVFRAMQLVSQAWTKRGPETALSRAFVDHTEANDIVDLLEGYTMGRYQIDGSLAPRIFEEAEAGDQVARQLINWAGNELGELAKAVIRQLKFKSLEFEVVLVGSMFEGGQLLIDPMQTTIEQIAPGARLVKLTVPPVVGALLIGMRAGGMEPTPEIRENLVNSLS